MKYDMLEHILVIEKVVLHSRDYGIALQACKPVLTKLRMGKSIEAYDMALTDLRMRLEANLEL
jgi:hypothetical protein